MSRESYLGKNNVYQFNKAAGGLIHQLLANSSK